ncbi:MAG: NAD(P)/FAD-dependent oxidoreductase [Humibacillus sp.]|nr:NAD(P)/FAD-dependent oxidoreductase [Humibacillus sp.]MDN5775844.1 NAD(P)/FAD-dependent oxidoreductase [Humibacillus sp.]
MKVAIIGAGFSGLATAKVLTALGHDVTVYDKTPDVGGVWSVTRRYPGLCTQNNKGTYAFSDHPMPQSYPEWPSGEQVQAYLESYVARFDLSSTLRLGTEVTSAVPADTGGWTLRTSADTLHYDHLVVANGIFSTPFVPRFAGEEEFRAAGGEVGPAGSLHDHTATAGRHVVVVGYGKSACDVAVEVSKSASSTTVVTRELLWKLPRKLGGLLNYKFLMLTRLGEGLFRYRSVSGVERVLHANDSALAGGMLGSVGAATIRQLGLADLGLVPNASFGDIARSTVSLATEGFFPRVRDGSIAVARDCVIDRLEVVDGAPHAALSDGRVVPADLVIAATGFRQVVPFLSEEVTDQLLDRNGDYQLYRQILPIAVPDLTFNGYNSSLFSPLSAEMSAAWIGSHLARAHRLPSPEAQRQHVTERLAWMKQRTRGKHARGTNIIPFSLHNIDEVLGDLGLDVGPGRKAMQWLLPVSPSAYSGVMPRLVARLTTKPTTVSPLALDPESEPLAA